MPRCAMVARVATHRTCGVREKMQVCWPLAVLGEFRALAEEIIKGSRHDAASARCTAATNRSRNVAKIPRRGAMRIDCCNRLPGEPSAQAKEQPSKCPKDPRSERGRRCDSGRGSAAIRSSFASVAR